MATVVLQYAGAAVGTALGGPLGGAVGRALGGLAGNLIDQRLFGNGRKRFEGPRLNDLRVMASEEGAAIPVLWGRMRVAGQVIWATNLLEVQETTTEGESSKGGSSATETKVTRYTYFANLAIGLCEGEIDGIGRVWADGREIDVSAFTHRLHRGTDTQNTDSLIAAVEGAGEAPAYRGLAYVVFERLPLGNFGNRIPQLSFEIFKRGNAVADAVKAVCIIPGSTEFGYDTLRVSRNTGNGDTESENGHASATRSDWSVSLDQLQDTCRNIDAASLVVSWFGTDLRCNVCDVKPGVDFTAKTTVGDSWKVAGQSRAAAYQVSRISGVPAYGGTPSDQSVKRAIADLKARGMKVVFYPFILMDVAQGNSLPNPYGGTGQDAYPWRGRITASIAPGLPGTPDKTASAATQVANLVGTAGPSDFSISGGEVIYSGPAEWSLRRLVLHYAKLCAIAGGVDAFLIGSEMRGLSTLRSAAGTYPFVAALQALAADVRSILPTTKISYAADWSEYFGHHPVDGSNDVYFHLDPLWASANINFIGIDNYMPLSDWRDVGTHLDALAGAKSIYDRDYLKGNIAGGEGFDWHYASDADRETQTRTAITDGAYGKPWVFRAKDLKSWWTNPHYNRPGGVESGTATAWLPQSKPVWLTELGCPAIDKGSNQPNVFFDAKSSESATPYYSGAQRDDLMQSRLLEATHSYWSAAGTHNPTSTEYAGRMVDATRLFCWAWDARPFPQFPALEDVWSDGVNYARGHWLNGRLGAVDLGSLVEKLCARFGLSTVGASDIAGQVDGFLLDRPMSGREAMESLLQAFSIDAVESGGALRFMPRDQGLATVLVPDSLVDVKAGQPLISETRSQETDLPRAVRLGFAESGLDYRAGAVWQRRVEGAGSREIILTLPAAVSQSLAQARADILLEEAWQQRSSSQFALPQKYLSLEPGDVVSLNGRDWRLSGVTDGEARVCAALAHDAKLYAAWPAPPRKPTVPAVPHYGAADVLLMDLAMPGGTLEPAPWLAARADPWPRQLAVLRRDAAASFSFNRVSAAQATMGATLGVLPAGLTDRIDYSHSLDVLLGYGALSSVTVEKLLNGGNRAVIGDAATGFEIIQFQNAELVAAKTWRLSGLIRALEGSAAEMLATRAAGSRFELLNAAVVQLQVTLAEAADDSTWRIGPLGLDQTHESYVERTLPPTLKALRPLAPVRLSGRSDGTGVTLSWIRQSRNSADSWTLSDIPLGEQSEAYRVTVLAGATVKRSIDVATASYLYSTAAMTADFGGLPASFTARVQQLSASFGPGQSIERIINV